MFSPAELHVMRHFESMDYLPQSSKVYRDWVFANYMPGGDNHWDKWVLMGLVGYFTGVIGFLLKAATEVITEAKYEFAQEALDEGRLGEVFAWVSGISSLMVLVSASLVVFIAPEAAGSGVPAVIGYLNGVYIHHLYDVRVFLVKFFSTMLAVASGLPVGPEGPMVYMGATIGKHLSQGSPNCYSKCNRCFRRFRTMQGRRDFISAGAAAGIASAFGAPVGGMLFAMEEVASFWNMTLAWQIMFTCMVATFTTDVLVTSFGGFKSSPGTTLGAINEEAGILFGVSSSLSVNVLIFLPTVVLGAVGGATGAAFTFISVKVARARKQYIEPYRWRRVLEPLVIMFLMSTVAVFLPGNFNCQPKDCSTGAAKSSPVCLATPRHPLHAEQELHRYACPRATSEEEGGSGSGAGHAARRFLGGTTGNTTTHHNGTSSVVFETYNPAASLLFVTGESAVEHLFSRKTHYEFDYSALFSLFLCYFPLAVWCAGSAVSSGLVVPILIIGACLGRIAGVAITDMTGDLHADENWNWIDPGGFALIGAAAFFGGVSRLTISLTVIMMEITNDIRFLLPIMTAVLVSKLTADKLTHSLYHALLDVKCVPFINSTPPPSDMSLDLLPVAKVMSPTVDVIPLGETSVLSLTKFLKGSKANAFPVVEQVGGGGGGGSSGAARAVFRGMLLRKHLLCLMKLPGGTVLKYEDLEGLDNEYVHTFSEREEGRIIQNAEAKVKESNNVAVPTISIEPYMDVSAMSVREDCPTSRAFLVFRSLGLRHLTVVDKMNTPVGMITRKDLLGMHIEHAVHMAENPLHAHHA